MASVIEMNHPLVSKYLSVIRNKDTDNKDFRDGIRNIAKMEFYEATKNLKTVSKEVVTPVSSCISDTILEEDIVIIPVLRAGLCMSEGIMEIVPNAKEGMIGLYRDSETKKPIEYLVKLPEGIENKKVFLVDPMLATGGSVIYSLDLLKSKGCKDITLLSVIAAPEGLDKVSETHNDVDIYIGHIDEYLNENKYIVPGLGDAGDRIFGTDK